MMRVYSRNIFRKGPPVYELLVSLNIGRCFLIVWFLPESVRYCSVKDLPLFSAPVHRTLLSSRWTVLVVSYTSDLCLQMLWYIKNCSKKLYSLSSQKNSVLPGNRRVSPCWQKVAIFPALSHFYAVHTLTPSLKNPFSIITQARSSVFVFHIRNCWLCVSLSFIHAACSAHHRGSIF